MELKIQSNRDIREISATASRAPSEQSSPSSMQAGKENSHPSEPSTFLNSPVEDIRFRQAPVTPKPLASTTSTLQEPSAQPSASQKFQGNSKPAFYNRGQPRTYLSDRHLRNVDVRELSSNRVSFGYQYPSPAGQSAGPTKKVPEGFSRPKPPTKAPSYSKFSFKL